MLLPMQGRLLGLDALRGIAAVMVALFHAGLPIAGAHLAVDFFFMLSGFVMARTYEQRLRSGAIGPVRFVVARYRRLWGWMALGTTTGLVALVAQAGLSGDLLLAFGLMLAMLPALNLPAAPYLLNQPLWSIVYELVANAAHGLVFARMGRTGLVVVAVACALGLAWSIATVGFPRGGFPEYHWLALLRVGLGYVLGILLFRLFGDTAPLPVPFAAAAWALPAYVLAIYLWPVAWGPLAFILLLCPLMMFGGLAARFATAGARKAAALLGAISFPLYALHVPALMLMQVSWGPLVLAAAGFAGWLWWQRAATARAGRGARSYPIA